MVDFADLSHINALYSEAESIDRGLDNLANDGVIVSMTISPWPMGGSLVPPPPPVEPPTNGDGPPTEPLPPPPVVPFRFHAIIDTTHLTYPQQMVDGITQQLRARRTAIDNELAALGVTGLPPGPRSQPQPAAPPQSQGGRPRPTPR
jgi:hypothetical protein